MALPPEFTQPTLTERLIAGFQSKIDNTKRAIASRIETLGKSLDPSLDPTNAIDAESPELGTEEHPYKDYTIISLDPKE